MASPELPAHLRTMADRRGPFHNPFRDAADDLRQAVKTAKKERRHAKGGAGRPGTSRSNPSARMARDPAARDPAARDPPARDPSARDPSARDPSARDPSARDPSASGPGAAASPSAPAVEPPSDEPPALDGADLFLQAVGDARRLHDPRGLVRPPPPPPAADVIPVYDEDAEAYAELTRLVEGRARFDISDSDEFIEGCVEGLDRRILQKLRRGDFAFRSHLDLHGLTKEEAKDTVERFLWERREAQHRCVLIVHGRGRNSKDNIPVLKQALLSWLQRGRISRCVLAFCTARPHDGGAGAMYVLLRR